MSKLSRLSTVVHRVTNVLNGSAGGFALPCCRTFSGRARRLAEPSHTLALLGRRAPRHGVDLRETGFTLVEVMIVVMIIGILSSIATPAILHAAKTAKYKQAAYDLEVIGSAIRRLAWDTGKWPGGNDVTSTAGDELEDLTTPAAGLLSFTNTLFSASKWKGPYIKRIETDPWNTHYFWDEDYETGHGREIGKSGKIVGIETHTVVGSYGPNKRGKNVYDDDDTYLIIK
jgi:general secretion pathway protein G